MEKDFLENHSTNSKLNEAVIEQMGGFQAFSENAKDIADHGIDAGYVGFTTYSDTNDFTQKNRDVILKALKEDVAEMGSESVPEMMSNWKALEGYSVDEIAEALYSNNEELEAHTPVTNAMAWYAGEKASSEYVNAEDELERDNAIETNFDSIKEVIDAGKDLGKDQAEFLKNFDQYIHDAGLSVESAEYKEVGNVEVTLTNYKSDEKGFREDVNFVVGKEQVQVETQDGLKHHDLADLNKDFSPFKNQIDAEMRDEYTLSILGQDNSLVKTSGYEIEQAIDGMLNTKQAQEISLSINGEQVAVKNSDFLAVNSGHGELTSSFEKKGADVVALDEIQDFKSLIAEGKGISKDKSKDNGMEL